MLDSDNQVHSYTDYSYWCILRNVTSAVSQEVFICSLRIRTEGHFLIRALIGETVSSSTEPLRYVEVSSSTAPSASILRDNEAFVLRLTREVTIQHALLDCSFLHIDISLDSHLSLSFTSLANSSSHWTEQPPFCVSSRSVQSVLSESNCSSESIECLILSLSNAHTRLQWGSHSVQPTGSIVHWSHLLRVYRGDL